MRLHEIERKKVAHNDSMKSEVTLDNFLDHANQIKQNCQPFLNQVDNPLGLFRGFYGNEDFMSTEVRLSGREPRGMSRHSKDVINKAFEENFGEPFRDSLMSVGDAISANAFGAVNHVFPVGDFTFLWSPEVDDINFHIMQQRPSQDPIGLFVSNLGELGYTTNNLSAAMASGHEIMIRCQKVFLLSTEYVNWFVQSSGIDVLDKMMEVLVA